ncbi:hypothetical protein, partial [Klebsiella pneumoniae]|uniref:hypothetical protein n=1 Tax=Klebsiella pneumoniae TaxID=573 RepID=UPI00200DCEA4
RKYPKNFISLRLSGGYPGRSGGNVELRDQAGRTGRSALFFPGGKNFGKALKAGGVCAILYM